VSLVRTDVLEESMAFEMPILTRATWHNIPEDGIIHETDHLKICHNSYIEESL
jgi:hypothetical protein